MLHTNNSIIKHKTALLNLAQELGYVSKACKVMGVSRETFYRYQELVEDGGLNTFFDKSSRSQTSKTESMKKLNKPWLSTLLTTQLTVSIEKAANLGSKMCLYPAAVFARFGYAMT